MIGTEGYRRVMRLYTLSFHNHLPIPKNRWWEAAAVRMGHIMIHNALRSGIDILCLNQWATAQDPFFFYNYLAQAKPRLAYDVKDCHGYMVITTGEHRLLLIKGLEIAVLTAEDSHGEVILLGVDSDFPIAVGELPDLVASPRQKKELWRQMSAYMEAGCGWLSIIPHPCFEGGFGAGLTLELVGSGRVDTFERYNSMLALFDPEVNRKALELEEQLSTSWCGHFCGITGNDGIDPEAPTLSLTQVMLDGEVVRPEELLSALALKIRHGQVVNYCRPAKKRHAVLKFLHSRRRWEIFNSRFRALPAPGSIPRLPKAPH
jgi:hypothetical protein